MTREQAIEIITTHYGNDIAPMVAAGDWGRLAMTVLDESGETELADAIWAGRD